MSVENLTQARMEKLGYVSERVEAYPDRYDYSHTLVEARKLEDGTSEVKVAGRIIFVRKMGKMSFVMLSNIEGKMQLAIKKDLLGEEAYELFDKGFDIGDFMGAEGEVFTTRTGEKTIRATNIVFLGKSYRPLPEKFHGISSTEECYRQRYLDLIMNTDTRDRFLLKINFVREVRRYLEDDGYMEIETPVLIDHPSGASAKPFQSHHNALDMDVYMRIAPETYLKRAVVSGFNKVFEFARCFRNEGIDATHLQDFTMLEGYCAYYNYRDNMIFLQKMLLTVIEKVFGETRIKIGDQIIDFDGEWPVISFRQLLINDCDIDIKSCDTAEDLLNCINEKGIDLISDVALESLGKGNLIDLLYKKVSRPKMINPVFLTEHPKSLSPLARANNDDPDIVDRFQLVINGAEVINAYSELVDPVDQRQRLKEQAMLKAGGDEEAMEMDEEYLLAMEQGMPPISGWGMGIDRVLQILTGQDNIKDMIMFPLMRPKQ